MFNNLRYIDEYVEKEISKNRNRRFSSLFRDCRKRVPLIGDYPIMSHVAFLMGKLGIKLNPNKTWRAVKSSKEYLDMRRGDKMRWVSGILNANTRSEN
jgi:hypothetical protein